MSASCFEEILPPRTGAKAHKGFEDKVINRLGCCPPYETINMQLQGKAAIKVGPKLNQKITSAESSDTGKVVRRGHSMGIGKYKLALVVLAANKLVAKQETQLAVDTHTG